MNVCTNILRWFYFLASYLTVSKIRVKSYFQWIFSHFNSTLPFAFLWRLPFVSSWEVNYTSSSTAPLITGVRVIGRRDNENVFSETLTLHYIHIQTYVYIHTHYATISFYFTLSLLPHHCTFYFWYWYRSVQDSKCFLSHSSFACCMNQRFTSTTKEFFGLKGILLICSILVHLTTTVPSETTFNHPHAFLKYQIITLPILNIYCLSDYLLLVQVLYRVTTMHEEDEILAIFHILFDCLKASLYIVEIMNIICMFIKAERYHVQIHDHLKQHSRPVGSSFCISKTIVYGFIY